MAPKKGPKGKKREAPKIERTYGEKQSKLYRGIRYRKVCIAENDAKIGGLRKAG